MAINVGTPLASSNPGRSEHEGKYRRQLNFDPHTGSIAADKSRSFGNRVGSFTSNLMFNFLDSVTFGVPSSRMRKNMQEINTGMWSPNRYSYGDRWDRLGIKPREELSGADYFAYGLGQAAGFFVPFMKLSKATTATQRLLMSNFDQRIGQAVARATAGGLGDGSVRSIDTFVKARLRGQRHTIPHIYRATPEQYRLYNEGIMRNIDLGVREGIERAGRAANLSEDAIRMEMRNADGISRGILQTIEEFGQQRKFIDNLPDLVNSFALREGAHPALKYVTGYVGRAVDQGVNMALFDGLGRLTRATFGEPIEGVDDVPLAQSLAHSAGFAAAIALGDFIPGGRRAGMFRDFAKFAKVNLAKSRNFSQMLTGSSGSKLSEKELRSVAAFFSNVSGKPLHGFTSKEIAVGAGDIKGIARELDRLYSDNRRDLLKAIIKDTGRSLAGSLPRAGVDAIITASYMGMSGMAIINDESLIGDYLVGAFMAMRAHQPLNPRAAMRWRYNNTIDAKMTFMENMGMDVSTLKNSIPYMQQGLQEMQFHAANIENLPYHGELYNALYGKGDYDLINVDGGETRSTYAAQRQLINDLNTIMLPSYVKQEGINFGAGLRELNNRMLNRQIPDALNMSDTDIIRIWDSIKGINVHDNRNPRGKSKKIQDYLHNFDDLMEAMQIPIIENHRNSLVNTTRETARELGIIVDDDVVRGGTLKIRQFSIDPSTNHEFSNLHYFRRLVNDLVEIGFVREEAGEKGPINVTEVARRNIEEIDSIINNFHNETANRLNASHVYTSTDNPVREYLSMHKDLVNKNRVKDIITGTPREDRDHAELRTMVDDVVGDQVEAGRRFFVEEAPEGRVSDENARLNAESLLNSLVQLKSAANKIMAPGKRLTPKSIDYDQAIGFYKSLIDRGIVSVIDGEVYYGNFSETSLFRELQAKTFSEFGLGDREFVMLQVLQSGIGDRTGMIKIPTETDMLTKMVRQYYESFGRSDDAKITEDVAAYTRVLNMLQPTNRIENDPARQFNTEQIRDIVTSLEAARLIENAQIDDSRRSYAELTESIRKRVDDIEAKAVSARARYNAASDKESVKEQFLRDSEEIYDSLVQQQGIDNVIPRAVDDLEAFKMSIEQARKEGDISSIFRNYDTISEMSRYTASLSKLVNTTSREGWAYANIIARQNVINEILKTTDVDRAELDNQTIIDLVKTLGETTGDYQSITRVVDSLRDVVRANLGIHLSSVEYNSNLNTSILKESLDMLSSHERRISIDSLMRRFSENPTLKRLYMDGNSRFNQDFAARLLLEGDAFRSNIDTVVETIRAEIGETNFNADSSNIAKELLSAVIAVNTRKESRSYYTLDGDMITLRTEHNLPRTPMLDFIESINTADMRVLEMSNNIISKDGVVRRFTDSNNYNDIEATIQDAFQVVRRRDPHAQKEMRENVGTEEGADRMAAELVERPIPREAIMQRPVFVDVKASDDIGVVFDLTRESAGNLLARFNDVSFGFKEHLKRTYPDGGRLKIIQWEAIEKNIISSLENLSEGRMIDSEVALGDLRSAVRSIYYADHIGRDFMADMLGEASQNGVINIDSMSEAQQRAFKYIHHSDNTNATRIDAGTAERISMLLSNKQLGSGEQRINMDRVAEEASRRAREGVRIAFFDDNEITARSTIGDVIRRTLTERYEQSGVERNQIPLLVERTIQRTIAEDGVDSRSLDQPILDGSIYASENAMRFDSYVMLRDFTEGSRAAKISFHDTGSDTRSGLIAKMASRFDPSVSTLMKSLEIDYLVPATSAKVHRGKANFTRLSEYDVLKSVAENLSGISDNFTRGVYPSETVRYMFGAHEFGSASRTNSSVTHYWSYEALRDFSDQIGIQRAVDNILISVKNSLTSSDISSKYTLTNTLRNKYDEIKNSGDYSHLGVIEQFIHWGLTSDSDLVRDQVVRHVRDIAITNAIAKNSATVSNTFLFSNSELASPIFANDTGNIVSRYGEVNLSDAMRDVRIGDGFSIIANRATANDMSDIVFGRRQKAMLAKDSTERQVEKANLDALQVIHNVARELGSYGNAHQFLSDITGYSKRISDAPDAVRKLIAKDYGNRADEIFNALRTLTNAGISDFAIAANSHKIPKKFSPDSVVNRVRGFVNSEKGNITELNNYEIAMQHQADQDGDKITVYLDNPVTALLSSMDSMKSGREVYSLGAGGENISPNVFNLYAPGGSTSREAGTVGNITRNNTLRYISAERKSKQVVGSVVKMQGVMTMLKESGIQINGLGLEQIVGDTPLARQYNAITGSITQSVLDAWKGVNPSLLDISRVKDFILFGERLDGIDYDANPAFRDWKGLFADQIEAMNLEAGQVEVVRDIVRENIKIFERAYSAFGDSYDMGTTIRPTFDTLLYVKNQFDTILNNDYMRVYRSIRARRSKMPNFESYMQNFQKLLGVQAGRTEVQRQIISYDKSAVDRLKNSYPQLVALNAFTTNKLGGIRIDQYDRPQDINRTSSDFQAVFNDGPRDPFAKDTDNLVSDLRIREKVIDEIINGLEKTMKASDILAEVTAPRRLSVLQTGLENHISSLKRRKYFYENINHVEDAEVMQREISHYEGQLDNVERRIAEFNHKQIETGVINRVKKNTRIFAKGNGNYVYRIRSYKGGYELDPVGNIRAGAERTFPFDTIVLRNPIKVNDVSDRAILEGIGFEAATMSSAMRDGNYLTALTDAGMDSREVHRFQSQARAMIEHAKAELRKIDAETYDLVKKVPGGRLDAYDDARLYVDAIFNNLFSRINHFAENNQNVAHVLHDVFAKMLYSPRLVGSHIDKMGENYVPYYKMDRKFATHLTRYLKDHESRPDIAATMESVDKIFRNATAIINNRQGVYGDPQYFEAMGLNRQQAMQSYERSKLKGSDSLMESLMRMAGKNFEVKSMLELMDNPRPLINDPGTYEFLRTDRLTRRRKNQPENCVVF